MVKSDDVNVGYIGLRIQKIIFSLWAWRTWSLGFELPKNSAGFWNSPTISWKNYNWFFGMNGMVCMYLKQTIVHSAITSRLSDLLLYIGEKILLGTNV